jgi:hypothetical protein
MRGRGWRQELKLRKTVEERRRDTSHVEMASRSVFDSENVKEGHPTTRVSTEVHF